MHPAPPEWGMVHCAVLRRFAPLGPTFRGRDDVRILTMEPKLLCHRLLEVAYFTPNVAVVSDEDDALLAWMVRLRRECSASRPMTVRPPVMRLE